MISIACVYRSGGDFTADDVAKLAASVKRHVRVPYRFNCFTDRPDEVRPFVDDIMVLTFDWPGWWAKMELFELSGPVVYFDLDTLILGPITELCNWVSVPTNEVLMLRGFYRNDHCSGIMAWNCDLSWLSKKFAHFSQYASWTKQEHGIGCGGFQGDQNYIRGHLHSSQIPIVFAQSVQNGIYSYKVHVQEKRTIPADTSVICFHGRPRPFEVNMEKLCH